MLVSSTGFVRHYWRTRIETLKPNVSLLARTVSSAITGGRGLKRRDGHSAGACTRGFVRHYWRTRIETRGRPGRRGLILVSSAITGGRGLKHGHRRQPPGGPSVSSAITGGRGLKRMSYITEQIGGASFVRHYWRTRIETSTDTFQMLSCNVSSAITGGRGLKPSETCRSRMPILFRPPLLADAD